MGQAHGQASAGRWSEQGRCPVFEASYNWDTGQMGQGGPTRGVGPGGLAGGVSLGAGAVGCHHLQRNLSQPAQ